MSHKFKKDGGKGLPPISTASLPDIIFMLLFFFMVSTTIRNEEVIVKVKVPEGTRGVVKVEKKSAVSYMHVGVPKDAAFGTEAQLQLNDKLANVQEITNFVETEKAALDESDKGRYMLVLKGDGKARMGIISKITYEARKAKALNFMYASNPRTERR